ncbi:MAG: copper-binding protein [Desulfovibrio sp.]|jgi:Cu/Ag efflux protein CusF|nr:copper-binding protein [Desulfovibrio sp.]
MHVRQLLPALVLALSLVSLPASAASHDGGHGAHGASGAAPAAQAAVYSAKGTITLAEKTEGRITIRHEPVPALNWPAMTMRFRLEDPSLAEGLKEGEAVRFDFRNEASAPVIVNIESLN